MTIATSQLIRTAREWLGTPWHHQAALKGVGCDCAGLVMGAAAEAGLDAGRRALAEVGRLGYPRLPRGGELMALCDRYMQRVARDERCPGDVLLFRYFEGAAADAQMAQHLALVAVGVDGREMMIHGHAPSRKVVEVGLAEPWLSRLAIVYRIPGLEG